ncbi:hypothetical protein F5Y14DRAFT_417228 [Nemania sp. NC0429]|nr:hypothetical protein F5Y14DRAFT_417228 [Nemania sp. NC0429]
MSVDLNERHKRSHQHQNQRKTMTANREVNAVDHPCFRKTGETISPSERLLVNSETTLRSPPVSPLTPDPPILRHIMAPPGDLDVPSSYNASRLHCPQLSTVPGGVYRSPVASPLDGRPKQALAAPPNYSHTTLRPRRHKQPPWTPPSSHKKNDHVDASQVNSVRSKDSDGLKQTQISFSGPRTRSRRARAQGDVLQSQVRSEQPLNSVEPDTHRNMYDMFSTARKTLHYQLSQEGNKQQTRVDCGSEPQLHRQQPSRKRQPFGILQTNTFRHSEPPQEDREPIPTTLPTGDPRAYLLRRQKSMAAAGRGSNPRKLRRMKSSLLPLENIPPEYHVHDLSWTPHISSSILDELVQWTGKYDEYVIHGTFFDGLDLSLADGRAVELQLQKLLAEQKENIGDRDASNDPVIIDLQTILKGKGVADAPEIQL